MLSNMNNAEQPDAEPRDAAEEPAPGPSLVLLYSLIAVALAVAIGLATLIVLPFYRHT